MAFKKDERSNRGTGFKAFLAEESGLSLTEYLLLLGGIGGAAAVAVVFIVQGLDVQGRAPLDTIAQSGTGITVAVEGTGGTPTPQGTVTPVASASPTATVTPTASASPTTTASPTSVDSPTPTVSPTPVDSPTPTVSPTSTVTPSASPTTTVTVAPSPVPTPNVSNWVNVNSLPAGTYTLVSTVSGTGSNVYGLYSNTVSGALFTIKCPNSGCLQSFTRP
jgi:hypothetical protein